MRIAFPWHAYQTVNATYTNVGYAYVVGAWGCFTGDTDTTPNSEL
jgi:hypothetical protein